MNVLEPKLEQIDNAPKGKYIIVSDLKDSVQFIGLLTNQILFHKQIPVEHVTPDLDPFYVLGGGWLSDDESLVLYGLSTYFGKCPNTLIQTAVEGLDKIIGKDVVVGEEEMGSIGDEHPHSDKVDAWYASHDYQFINLR